MPREPNSRAPRKITSRGRIRMANDSSTATLGSIKHDLRATDTTATLGLLAIAAAITLLHLLTNQRYGLHRDDLQFLSDARHFDWGFVSYPPFTAFVERISL